MKESRHCWALNDELLNINLINLLQQRKLFAAEQESLCSIIFKIHRPFKEPTVCCSLYLCAANRSQENDKKRKNEAEGYWKGFFFLLFLSNDYHQSFKDLQQQSQFSKDFVTGRNMKIFISERLKDYRTEQQMVSNWKLFGSKVLLLDTAQLVQQS